MLEGGNHTRYRSLRSHPFDSGGNPVGEYAVGLSPGERKQEDRPFFSRAGLSAMAAGSARVTVAQGSGIIASASVAVSPSSSR